MQDTAAVFQLAELVQFRGQHLLRQAAEIAQDLQFANPWEAWPTLLR